MQSKPLLLVCCATDHLARRLPRGLRERDIPPGFTKPGNYSFCRQFLPSAGGWGGYNYYT